MEARRYISLNPAATREAASRIAGILTSGCVIALSGPLGAGKTEFAKGFAAGLGIRDNVVSPTFTLEAAYEVPPVASSALRVLHHWDMYRLGPESGENEVVEYASSPGDVVLVEEVFFGGRQQRRSPRCVSMANDIDPAALFEGLDDV